MKKICAITMVRDDEFFLRKWIEYYGSQLGESNLYVFFDGRDQTIPDFCQKANTILCDRVKGMVAKADKGRINFLSDQAKILLGKYDLVIGTDVDEFLVVDPKTGKGLQEYLSSIEIKNSVSGLGIDIGQHMKIEAEINGKEKFLSQRHFGYLSSRYTKANVISFPVKWGSGFHRVKRHNFHIDKNLYLFHFGCIDLNMLKKRMKETDRMENGWSRHLKKRAKTITIVTDSKPYKWDSIISKIRVMQTLLRPIFAWNKPTVLGLKFVVEIPERFRNIL